MAERKGKLMYMPRDYKLLSLTGYSIQFRANVPTIVPSRAIDEAIAIGAVFSNKEEQKVLVDEPRKLIEPAVGFEREQHIYDACTKIMISNHPDDFTPGSKPTIAAVRALVGYDVDRKEINDIWNKVMSAQANAS